MNNPKLKILLDTFTRNSVRAVELISGRTLSPAELGSIREQCAAVLKAAFLAGMVEKQNRVQAHFEPWDTDNDPTDPYIRKTKQC